MLPWGMKIGGEKHLVAIRDGLVTTMPLIIIGSIFVILSNVPWEGFNLFVTSILAGMAQQIRLCRTSDLWCDGAVQFLCYCV